MTDKKIIKVDHSSEHERTLDIDIELPHGSIFTDDKPLDKSNSENNTTSITSTQKATGTDRAKTSIDQVHPDGIFGGRKSKYDPNFDILTQKTSKTITNTTIIHLADEQKQNTDSTPVTQATTM